jgi:hypothetical protein
MAPALIASSGVISRVRADLGIHLGLDRIDLLAAQRLGMREIEPEMVGRDQAALLRNVIAEPMAQRRVEQMRRAVVGADPVAALGIHKLMHGFAHRQLALHDLGAKHVELAERLRCILNVTFEAFECG